MTYLFTHEDKDSVDFTASRIWESRSGSVEAVP